MLCSNPVMLPLRGETKFYKTFKNPASSAIRMVPCGKCIHCLTRARSQWIARATHELSTHEHNSFIHLTYNNENIPYNNSLNPDDIVLFLKRLRKALGKTTQIRYYGCGEYGDKKGRPHYHVIIYGYDFPDRKLWKRSDKGNLLYVSKQLDDLWGKGYAYVSCVDERAIKYSSGYVYKKINEHKTTNYIYRHLFSYIHKLIRCHKPTDELSQKEEQAIMYYWLKGDRRYYGFTDAKEFIKNYKTTTKDNKYRHLWHLYYNRNLHEIKYFTLRGIVSLIDDIFKMPAYPEYQFKSKGLGRDWALKYYNDYIQTGYIQMIDKKHKYQTKIAIPRYYINRWAKEIATVKDYFEFYYRRAVHLAQCEPIETKEAIRREQVFNEKILTMARKYDNNVFTRDGYTSLE